MGAMIIFVLLICNWKLSWKTTQPCFVYKTYEISSLFFCYFPAPFILGFYANVFLQHWVKKFNFNKMPIWGKSNTVTHRTIYSLKWLLYWFIIHKLVLTRSSFGKQKILVISHFGMYWEIKTTAIFATMWLSC